MRRVVLDAPAFLTWFRQDRGARSLRADYEAGMLVVITPRIFALQVLEAASRRPGWTGDRISHLGAELDRTGFELRDPPSEELAQWLARGANGAHAVYAALASALGLPLVTDDPELLRVAATVARSSADA